jgi:hypothetical protein
MTPEEQEERQAIKDVLGVKLASTAVGPKHGVQSITPRYILRP